jgi:hypothetical protein
MKRHALRLLLAAVIAASAGAARAQADPARTLFNAGAQAYEAGQFPAAIQAFEEAYRISSRPGILFSIAQAHRKQYYVSKSPQELRGALAGYRDYLSKVGSGGRRSDAAAAVAELEPLAARLDPSAGAAPPPQQAAQVTRLMVSSQTSGALVTLDGGKPAEAPLIAEVKPGKHALRVTGRGYFDEARDIEVAAGSVSALDIPLRDKPGHLALQTRGGAQVTIDGRFVATTPLSQPIDVEPGRHLLAVTQNGFSAYSREIEIERDEQKSLEIKLEGTTQRTASFVLIGAGAAAAVAGGVLVGLMAHEQNQATRFDTLRHAGGASCASDCATYVKTQYTDHVSARDDYRRDAAITGAAAALVAGTGIVLFAFDQPSLTAVRGDDAKKPTPVVPRDRPMEVSALPLVVPGFYGASLAGRF